MTATRSDVTGLAVRGLRVAHGERVVLRDVSFDAPKGTVTALVGPSGAGKSTLLRCLNRLLVPQAGTVAARRRRRAALEPCALRRRVGLVGQTPVMLPGSVRENLAYGLARAPATTRLHARARDAGLDATSSTAPPPSCRAASGRASRSRGRSTREPELLLLDEPTAALDAAAAEHVGVDAARARARRPRRSPSRRTTCRSRDAAARATAAVALRRARTAVAGSTPRSRAA